MHPKTLEIAFLKVFISKFPGGEYPRTPYLFSPLRGRKSAPIFYLFSAVPEHCDKLASCPVGLTILLGASCGRKRVCIA